VINFAETHNELKQIIHYLNMLENKLTTILNSNIQLLRLQSCLSKTSMLAPRQRINKIKDEN